MILMIYKLNNKQLMSFPIHKFLNKNWFLKNKVKIKIYYFIDIISEIQENRV